MSTTDTQPFDPQVNAPNEQVTTSKGRATTNLGLKHESQVDADAEKTLQILHEPPMKKMLKALHPPVWNKGSRKARGENSAKSVLGVPHLRMFGPWWTVC